MKAVTGKICSALPRRWGARISFRGSVFGTEKCGANWQERASSVLPTHLKNFGLAVAEALASGVPVIVTHGAPWQKVQSENCGWWIEHGVEPLAACLDEALAQRQGDLSEMGARGREWMMREFSWSRIGEMTLATYTWLLGRGSPPEWVRFD